jgi:hypothetical protein
MKIPKHSISSNASAFPLIRFEKDSQLTAFAGIQIFVELFRSLQLKERFAKCCSHLDSNTQYPPSAIVLLLVTHIILGFSRLRQVECYRQDPLVARFLGLNVIPSAPTLSRMLASMDSLTADRLVEQIESMVIARLRQLALAVVTVDFDGSITTTNGHAEGTAVGFNPKKKGQRSYYPLFATVAQLGQVLSVLHRSGNVHDSHQAKDFIIRVIGLVREALPNVTIEVRADSAFYSEELLAAFEKLGVQYTVSAPFERYPNLKSQIEGRKRWRRVDNEFSGFDQKWKADCWPAKRRFVFIKKRVKKQQKGPIQLDLFIPHEAGYEFTAIVTNKPGSIKDTALFHHGRGTQEKIFGELKNGTRIDYLPCKKEAGNRVYMLCNILAYNLTRELQIQNAAPEREPGKKRACLWIIESLSTLRDRVIRKAGRLTRPAGRLTLTIPGDHSLRAVISRFLPSTAIS